MAGGGLFDDIAGPVPQQAAAQPYADATPEQKAFLAANGATYDRSGLAPGVTFDTPAQAATDNPHVTTSGVLETPGVDAEHNIFSDLAPRRRDDMLGFQQTALKPLDNAASWLENGLGAIGVPVSAIDKAFGTPSADAVKQAHLDYIKGQAAVGVDPGVAGQVLGGIVGTAPLMALPGGALAQGALSAAALSDAKDAKGLALDAGVGAVGGKVGEAALNFGRGVISPQIKTAQQYLLDRGVRLTPGQILGGVARGAEDVVSGIPVLGELVKAGQHTAVDDFNRAAVNETLAPIGQSLPAKVATGHDAVAHATQTLGNAYDTALAKVSSVRPDAQFVTNMTGIGQNATSGIMPEPQVNQFKQIVKQRVLDRLSASPTGETAKLVDGDLAQLSRKYQASPDAAQSQLGDSIEATRAELRDLVARTNPQVASDLAKINAGWARLVRVQKAAASSGSKSGVFTPDRFNSAVVSEGSRSQASQGNALLQDLATAGKDVLPNKTPDSGSAGRAAAMVAGSALLGGHFHVEPHVLAAGVLGSSPYFGPGASAVRTLLTQRPAAAKVVADYLSRFKAPAAAVGASGAIAARDAWPQP